MILLVNCFMAQWVMGQFTYFNSLWGLEADERSDSGTNLEVLGDSLYVFGAGIDSGNDFFLSFIVDSEGNEISSVDLSIDTSYIYSGFTHSVLFHPSDSTFLFSQGVIQSEVRGMLLKMDKNLDTLWTRTYSQYSPNTYFYTHAPSTNGFILAGEHVVSDPAGRGTFIMEIDTAGNVLWHNEIHAPEEGLFRNRSISQLNSKFIVSGVDQAGNNQSYIEILGESGVLEEHLEPPNTPLGGGGSLYHFINSLGEIIVYQSAAYEWITAPSLAYNKIRVFKLDVDAAQLTLENEYFTNNEISGSIIKMIEVSDGYAISGWYRDFDNGNTRKAWIMKIDDDFQQEWYTELSYDDAPGNAHYPYDMEQTSDGGYVVVGAYRNSADFYDRTWLVKVDACGDLEWQGCEGPNGTWESQATASLSISPNPASDLLRVDPPSGARGERWQSLQVIDLQGRVVQEISSLPYTMLSDELQVDISYLKTGLYTILLRSSEGAIFTGEFMKE